MGAVASFYLLPKTALAGLRDAAPRVAGLTGTDEDPYWDSYWRYLEQHGREVVGFQQTGYVFGALLPYLSEQLGMSFKSEYDEFGLFLTEVRQVSHFVLTDEHRLAYLDSLSSHRFSETALGEFFNELYADSEPEAGSMMLAAVGALTKALAHL